MTVCAERTNVPPVKLRATTGAMVRVMMARHHENQHDLAEVLNIARSGVSRKIAGVTPWTIDELELLADHWQIPPSVLLMDPDDMFKGV